MAGEELRVPDKENWRAGQRCADIKIMWLGILFAICFAGFIGLCLLAVYRSVQESNARDKEIDKLIKNMQEKNDELIKDIESAGEENHSAESADQA